MIDLAHVKRQISSRPRLVHYGGFVLAGGLAFVTDASLLLMQTKLLGLSPFIARPISICFAMVVSWFINRTVTFRMHNKPSFREFMRFAAVAWSAQAINYAIFAVILLLVPTTDPLVALILACLVAMFFSYTGYRFGVFGGRGHHH